MRRRLTVRHRRRIVKDTAVGWRDGARHFVISFGDSVPHDNDLNQGVPAPQPHLAGQPFNTAYDPKKQPDAVDWQTVLAEMAKSEVTLLHVVSGSAASMKIPPQGMQQYWSYWTGLTAAKPFCRKTLPCCLTRCIT